MSEAKPQLCIKRTYPFGSMYGVGCKKTARIQDRDGAWWCTIHDPEYQAKRISERNARWEAEDKARAKSRAKQDRIHQAKEAVISEAKQLYDAVANLHKAEQS